MKKLLNEWRNFLNNTLINEEISFKQFKKEFPDFDTSLLNSQIRGNTVYLDIIKNSELSGQKPEKITDYITQFKFFKEFLMNKTNEKDLTIHFINTADGKSTSLFGKLDSQNIKATYVDIENFKEARTIQKILSGKFNDEKTNNFYSNVLRQESSLDFVLVSEDSDWIIYHPKSVHGSISLAKSYWDGSKLVYDKTFEMYNGYGDIVGPMKWCTTVTSQKNQFNDYSRSNKLFYCIKKNLDFQDDIYEDDPYRKICVSTIEKDNEVKISESESLTVNADNKPITEEQVKSIIGKSNLDRIIEFSRGEESKSKNSFNFIRLEPTQENLEYLHSELEGKYFSREEMLEAIKSFKPFVDVGLLEDEEGVYYTFLCFHYSLIRSDMKELANDKNFILKVRKTFKDIGIDFNDFELLYELAHEKYTTEEDILSEYPYLATMFDVESKTIANESIKDFVLLEEFIREALIDEAKRGRPKKKRRKSKSKYPSQYKAKGKRKSKLDKATALAKSSDPAKRKQGYEERERMEKAERNKKGFKNVPRHDTKKK